MRRNFLPWFEKETKSISKFLYIVRLLDTPEIIISWEHSDYRWVPLSELLTSVELRPFYKEAVEYCFASELI